jgi:hypothetical protein
MSSERRADPNCPYCHGSGTITINASFLDRVDESTTVCRCVSDAAVVDPSEEDTLVVKSRG